MNYRIINTTWLLAGILFFATACKKDTVITNPPSAAHFQNQTGDTYFVLSTTSTDTIPVGVTTVANEERTIQYSVSSPTGAVQGTHYTISPATVTIPAGKSTAYIVVQGMFNQYNSGRKDTLIFNITGGKNLVPAEYNSTFKLFMRGPCFNGDVSDAGLASLQGTYAKCYDLEGTSVTWGPYTMVVKNTTKLTPTTARAVINNVWDVAIGDVNFIMDWTDPNNTSINVEAPTVTQGDAGNLNSAYAGMKIVIRKPAARSGTFSVCSSKMKLEYQLGVYDPASSTILGYFPNVFSSTMER